MTLEELAEEVRKVLEEIRRLLQGDTANDVDSDILVRVPGRIS